MTMHIERTTATSLIVLIFCKATFLEIMYFNLFYKDFHLLLDFTFLIFLLPKNKNFRKYILNDFSGHYFAFVIAISVSINI